MTSQPASASTSTIHLNPIAQTWRNPSATTLHTISAITSFHQTLPAFAITPLHALPSLAHTLGFQAIHIKDESQRLGLPSFKILGASWATYRALLGITGLPLGSALEVLAAQAREKGISLFAATDGNHGRAVARLARILGIKACIYVPDDLSAATRAFIEDEGAAVFVLRGDYDFAVAEAAAAARLTQGGILIQDTMAYEGYEDVPEWVVEGYSTMLREIDEQLQGQAADLIVVPVGVGSLAQAVVAHYKAQNRTAQTAILTVEPESAACLQTSLKAGQMVTISTGRTIMSGMNCGTVSSSAWPLLCNGVDASVTVTESQAHEGVRYLEEVGISVGPCAGGTFAALKSVTADVLATIGVPPNPVVVVLCTEGSRMYDVPK